MTAAAVAVIGGGVIGASVAYHLAALGQRDVVVLDRATPQAPAAPAAPPAASARSTPRRSTSGSRCWPGRSCVRFADETGVDPGYAARPAISGSPRAPAELDVLREARAVQHAEGLARGGGGRRPTTSRRLNPAVRLDGVAGGAFCPTDGFIRPLRILEGISRPRRGSACGWSGASR